MSEKVNGQASEIAGRRVSRQVYEEVHGNGQAGGKESWQVRSGQILEVMTDIDDKYIQSALNRLDYLKEESSAGWKRTREAAANKKSAHAKKINKKTVNSKKSNDKVVALTIVKRAAVFIGVAILAMSTTVAAAMAVNEEFRETVKEIFFEFLHIEEEEVVPELSGTEEITIENMYVELDRSIIGGVIEGRYVHAPASCDAREGVYMICTDEIEMNQGSHYDAYYEENGEFVKLEEHTFSGDYTVLGNDFHIEFDWAVHGGQVALTYIGVEENFRIPANPGNADAMLVELLCAFSIEDGDNVRTAYPVLLNLETGELMDVLAGTGAENLMQLANQAISEDLSKMLLAQSDGTLYYVDLEAKKLYSVEELSGETADACSLIDNTLACWVLEEDAYRAWAIDLNTMERRELFSAVPNVMPEKVSGAGIVYLSGFDTTVHWGTMFSGSHFALVVEGEDIQADAENAKETVKGAVKETAKEPAMESGNVAVIDLVTGEKIPVEGFTWPEDQYEDILWEISPDGKRLLISGGQIGSKYEYIGVLDFEKLSYLEFSRKNQNEVYEWKPYWFDRDTVIIQAASKESSNVQDFYVYDLLDETAVIIEGMVEKVPTTVFEGKEYTIAIPEEGWEMIATECWMAEVNHKVQLWITDYAGEDADIVCGKLTDAGYLASEEDPCFLSYQDEEGLVWNVKLFAENDETIGVFYCYPAEAMEGFGTRLAKIVSTFEWKEEQ